MFGMLGNLTKAVVGVVIETPLAVVGALKYTTSLRTASAFSNELLDEEVTVCGA